MIYGIDLGTTFSAIAHVNPLGIPVCVPMQEGGKWTLPSAVLFVEENKVYVGEEAIDESWRPDSLLIEFAKRDIGLHNPGWPLKYKGWQYMPEEISALILRKVAQRVNAERSLPPVADVVVSHPQYFGLNQKEATSKAVELAGLNLVGTITEPGAAAIAYGILNPEAEGEKTVLVFDLGGGTFDVTIMSIGGKRRFKMLGSAGDARLGGINWDGEIVRRAKDEYMQSFNEDFDNVAREEEKIALRKAAERAKVELSKPDKTLHRFKVEAGDQKLFLELSRAEFEAMCQPLVKRCIERCERLFQEIGYNWSRIDEVLLVGSSTRMPMILDGVRRAAGKEPLIDSEPKLMVAKGAAIWGDWVSRGVIDPRWGETEEAQVAGLEMRDGPDVSGCTARGLGVLAKRGGREVVDEIVPRNKSTPCEEEKIFYIDRDGATSVLVPLYEGESEEPEHCYLIGNARLDGLPPRPKGQPVRVKFKIDVAGRLEVRVVDVETGREEIRRVDRNVLRGSAENQEPDWDARRKHLAEISVM
jgi:molecular chaperone DnaK